MAVALQGRRRQRRAAAGAAAPRRRAAEGEAGSSSGAGAARSTQGAGGTEASEAAAAGQLKRQLLELAAAGNRGQTSDSALKQRCEELIRCLEERNPTEEPARSALLEGQWRLVYATEDPTRCSPFFWALRQRMRGVEDPNPISRLLFGGSNLLDNTLAFTDRVPIKTVGLATQNLEAGTLVNQVVVGVFPTGESKMTTTCQYAPDAGEPNALRISVEKTQVLGASVAATLLDQISFPSGEFLGEDAICRMVVTYLDETLRIVRQGGRESACFAFSRVK